MIILRGAGDLGSGIALRLHRAGLRLLVVELPQPLVVRRLVSFAEAVYAGEVTVEGVTARRVENLEQARSMMDRGVIPVLVDRSGRSSQDPDASASILPGLLSTLPSPIILIDARMTKRPPDTGLEAADLVIGLGPGFVAGKNCHAVIETNRGPRLGRVIWKGAAEADTGLPEAVSDRRAERVLRAPAAGILEAYAEIGDLLEPGQLIAAVGGQPVRAPFRGVLRGLLHPGLEVQPGLKIGDVDPRSDPQLSRLVSDKALAVGGAALEAILTRPEIRARLWD